MNFYTYTLIGIFLVLLKPCTVYGDSYRFPNASCYELKGKSWKNVASCSKSPNTYSLTSSNELFCAYELKQYETAEDAAKKMKFYRNKKESNLINYNSGEIKKAISPTVKHVLFSKRDLLVKTKGTCKTVTSKIDLTKTYYFLHFPNSFYVLKSGLKKVNITKSSSIKYVEPKKEAAVFTKVKSEEKTTDSDNFSRSFTIKPRLFYEQLNGTQITNSTEATISGKLSPGLNLKLALGEHKNWQYGAALDLDFHIFDERAGEFLLNNNTVQTLALNLFTNFDLHKRFSVGFALSLYEDIYYARTSSSSLGLEKELVPRLTFATDLTIYRKNNFRVRTSPSVFYDAAAGPLMSGFGYQAPLIFEINRNGQPWSLGIEYLQVNKELEDLELERSTLSFYLETKVFF